MKKKLTVLFLVATMILTACGNTKTQNNKTSDQVNSPETSTESPAVGEIKAKKNLFTVEFTIPASLLNDCEVTNGQFLVTGNVIKQTKNADGSLTVQMTKKNHKKLMKETSKKITDDINTTILGDKDSYPHIVSVTPNDDFTSFKVMTTAKSTDDFGVIESFSGMAFILSGEIYQVFNCVQDSDLYVSVNYVNTDTNQTISTYTSDDLATNKKTKTE